MGLTGKLCFAAGLLMVTAPAIAEDGSGEIGYADGALGYDALVAGDNSSALKLLEASKKVHKNDPARLINLGQVYVRTGRLNDAANMFMAAMHNNRSFDLLLADGTVINSRKAAELALKNLSNNFASR
jgi:Flp pilus assembly protein TadD